MCCLFILNLNATGDSEPETNNEKQSRQNIHTQSIGKDKFAEYAPEIYSESSGYQLLRSGKYEESKEMFLKQISIPVSDDSLEYFENIRGLGIYYHLTGDDETYLDYYKQVCRYLADSLNLINTLWSYDVIIELPLFCPYHQRPNIMSTNQLLRFLDKKFEMGQYTLAQYNLYKGYLLRKLKQYKEAYSCFKIALQNMYQLTVYQQDYLYFMLAYNSIEIGERKQAVRYYNILLQTDKIRNLSFRKDLVYVNLLIYYRKVNENKKAEEIIDIYFNTERSKPTLLDINMLSIVINYKSVNGEWDVVFQHICEAEDIINKFPRFQSENIVPHILYQKSLYYKKVGNKAKQLEYLKDLVRLAETKFTHPYFRFYYRYDLCRYYESNNEEELAIKLIDKNLKEFYAMSEADRAKVLSIVNDFIPRNMRVKGLCYYFLALREENPVSELDSAYKYFNKSLELRREAIRYIREDESKLMRLKILRFSYQNVLVTCNQIHACCRPDSIYNIMLNNITESKAIIFRANLDEVEAVEYSGIPDDLVNLEISLKNKIADLSLEEEIDNSNEIESYIRLKQIVKLREDYDTLIRYFEVEYPFYFDLKYQKSNLKYEEIQTFLDPDELIINYYFLKNELIYYLINKDTVMVISDSLDHLLPGEVIKFREQLSSFSASDYNEKYFNWFVSKAQYFYNELISPIGEHIKGKKLLIVPDAELNILPFELLIRPFSETQELKVNDYAALPYLIKENTIQVIYSLEQLYDYRQLISQKSSFVGFAGDYNKNCIISSDTNFKSLPELIGAVEEIKHAGKFFHSRNFFSEKASEKMFLRCSPGADVVHLALHTEVNDELPMFSKFIFSQKCQEEDNLLYISEIYRKKLDIKLLVLSGCNTGSGKVQRGEGVLNLGKSFFYSGVSNIILTQWAVSDKSSAELMRRFYHYLGEGNRSDKALQLAKLDYLRTEDPAKLHPYYWAGYVSVGLPVTYKYEKDYRMFYMIAVVVMLFIALGFIYRRKFKVWFF